MDVYDAIPTIVTTFVAIIAKISIFIFLLDLVYHTNNNISEFSWTYGLLISSLLSLIIGTVVGLTQFRIKRLLAYSTISHVGFILLALAISSIESTQAFLFYLAQYSISNLNVFFIIITVGFSLYSYITNNQEYGSLLDKNYSPIQLVSQLKGFFYINSWLSLCLAITIFSFVGIPPLVGFFAKQMVLSAALDNGYVFLSLIAIIASVIGAVYYLNVIKEIYFNRPEHEPNPILNKSDSTLKGIILSRSAKKNVLIRSVILKGRNIFISSPFSITISIITNVILLFIFMNKEWLSMGKRKLSIYKASSNKYINNIRANSLVFCRNYTTNIENNNKHINPWFVTGFTDAEGSFMIHLEKTNDKWRVRPTFQIKLDIRDLSLLESIKTYFNEIGSINTSSKECVYKVRSLKEVLTIISHFDKYFLITQKRADFELFKLIVNKLNNKEHLAGLDEIVNICASMNLGLPLAVKNDFPNFKPIERPLIENMEVPHPEWMAGFISGEGSFSILGDDSISLSFRVAQHHKDMELFKSFVSFFDCGYCHYHNKDKKAVTFTVRKFNDINSIIIPFFNEYKIQGVKYKDFNDWSKVAKIIESKNHLTSEGQKEIRKIKENMNSYRV